MSIHFYKKGSTEKAVFHLSDSHFDELEKTFEKFESMTGIFIDPYGKVILYAENLDLLRRLLEENYSKSEFPNSIKHFLIFMEEARNEDLLIEAVGD